MSHTHSHLDSDIRSHSVFSESLSNSLTQWLSYPRHTHTHSHWRWNTHQWATHSLIHLLTVTPTVTVRVTLTVTVTHTDSHSVVSTHTHGHSDCGRGCEYWALSDWLTPAPSVIHDSLSLKHSVSEWSACVNAVYMWDSNLYLSQSLLGVLAFYFTIWVSSLI